ncbi:MAG: tetratricopeptide repeat protein [Kiritimatiellae bacterium]|nr:tetratricopeptide repeat protein [Kiritimatiellia bacterium]
MSLWTPQLAATIVAALSAKVEPIQVDVWHADPLQPAAATNFVPPPLKINVGEDLSRYVYRLLQSPPPTPPEIEQARQHYQRASEYLRQGEVGKAMLELRDGLTYTPDNPRLLELAGSVSIQMGKLEDAAGFYRRWLDVEPDNVRAAATYVGLLVRLSRIAEAEAVMQRYTPVVGHLMPFRFHRLCLDLIADRTIAADPFWQQRPIEDIVQLVQWLHDDRDALSRVLGATGYVRLCELILGPRAAAELPRLHATLARLLRAREQGKLTAALQAAREVDAMGVRAYGVAALLAELLEQTGDRAGALAAWRQILAEQPDTSQAWVSAAHVFLRNGRFEESLDAIRRAKELLPREPVVDFLLASALALSGRTAEAHPVYVQLVSRRPADFRRWLESDAVFEAALDRMPNKGAIMRRLDIPPELE